MGSVGEAWTTLFTDCSIVLEKFGKYVEGRNIMVTCYLELRGYLPFYNFAKTLTATARKIQQSPEYLSEAALHHENKYFDNKMLQFLSNKIDLNPLPEDRKKIILTSLLREDLRDGVSLYSLIVETVKNGLTDKVVLHHLEDETQLCQICQEISELYFQTHSLEISVAGSKLKEKKKKILDLFPLDETEIEYVHLETKIQKLIQLKNCPEKHARAILCYQIVSTLACEVFVPKTGNKDVHLFYLYFLQKVVQVWMGDFLSGNNTLLSTKDFPSLFEVTTRLKTDYTTLTKNHPRISHRRSSQKELRQKEAAIDPAQFYDTINL